MVQLICSTFFSQTNHLSITHMDIFKSILKIMLFVALVLSLGQLQLGQHTVGAHFLTQVENGSRWAGRQIVSTKWFAGLQLPDFLLKWLEPKADSAPSKRRTQNEAVPEESISKADREAMLRLLKE